MSETPKHPGTIEFVNGDTNEVVSRRDASELPDSVKFGRTKDGVVPVVKVVAHTAGNVRHVLEYGPSGELVRSTTQFAS